MQSDRDSSRGSSTRIGHESPVGGRPVDAHVTAEPDARALRAALDEAGRDEVGGEALADAAEIEMRATRQGDRRVHPVDAHAVATGRRARSTDERRTGRRNERGTCGRSRSLRAHVESADRSGRRSRTRATSATDRVDHVGRRGDRALSGSAFERGRARSRGRNRLQRGLEPLESLDGPFDQRRARRHRRPSTPPWSP